MKKILKKFGIILISFFIINEIYAEDELKLKSDAVVVIDNDTGRVLYSKNKDMKLSIASLTKVMTAIMLTENANMSDLIEVPKEAALVGGSTAGVKAGEKMTAKNLLYAMLLPSGNDAAYTIGSYIGCGDIKNFAYLMTKRANEIGATNTSFANPHGLDNELHYSTAYDVSLITRYALKNSDINEVVGTVSKTVDMGSFSKTFNNTNSLLRTFYGTDGVKTGFTNDANRCLIASCSREEERLIAVVLGADTTEIRFKEAKDVLDYSFKNYKMTDISNYLKVYVNIPVIKSDISYYEKQINFNYSVPLKNGEYDKIYLKQEFIDEIKAPMEAGKLIGRVKAYIDDEVIFEKEIYLDRNINKNTPLFYINKAYKDIFLEYSAL